MKIVFKIHLNSMKLMKLYNEEIWNFLHQNCSHTYVYGLVLMPGSYKIA